MIEHLDLTGFPCHQEHGDKNPGAIGKCRCVTKSHHRKPDLAYSTLLHGMLS